MICPNINLKEVKDGFNEMVEALGGRPLTDEEFRSSELRNKRTGSDYSAMEAAYRSYHRNNGNMLDKAPNGNDSVLFNSLLEHFGNRAEAIKAKANVYTDEFINWFGDWINNGLPTLSFMPKRNWNIGHIIDNPTDAANICDNTQIKVLTYIRSVTSKPSKGKINAKPVTIWAKSPINDKQIHHSTVAVRINDKVYLYDMPQSEYIKQIDFNKGEVVSEYTPRLIEYTEENLKKYYGTSEETLHLQDEVVLDNDLENISFNVSKVVDTNGEPKVRYHQTSENFNTFDPKISKRGSSDTETPTGIFTKPEPNDIFGDGSK